MAAEAVHSKCQVGVASRAVLMDHGSAGVRLQYYLDGLLEALALGERLAASSGRGSMAIVDARYVRELSEQMQAIAGRLVGREWLAGCCRSRRGHPGALAPGV